MIKQQVKDKLCLLYDGADSDFVKEAAQIKIIFRAESKNFEKFIEQNQHKRIYIEFKQKDFTADNLHRLQEIKRFDNWILQIPVNMILDDKKNVDNVKFAAIKDCCNKYMFLDLIGNWEILQFIKALEPCEVYLTNMLAFSIEKAKNIIGDIGVRVVCNTAQSAWSGSEDIRKFFVRPEDTEYFAPLVSGFDFVGGPNIQEVLYKVYSRGYWYGNLSEYIIGFNDTVDGRRLPQNFGEHRAYCEKRCARGSKCKLCDSMKRFSEKLEQTETIVIPKVKQDKE